MDPMSAIAIAGTAFNAIKAGFEHGREIETMAGDIGRWMGAGCFAPLRNTTSMNACIIDFSSIIR